MIRHRCPKCASFLSSPTIACERCAGRVRVGRPFGYGMVQRSVRLPRETWAKLDEDVERKLARTAAEALRRRIDLSDDAG